MAVTPIDARELDAGRHSVAIGPDALLRLEHLLASGEGRLQAFILGDENTMRQCLPELLLRVPALRDAGTIAVAPGEGSKSLETCRSIWEHLTQRAADRQTILVNLGGGVVSDLGGFVAGTYKRGIRFVNVPTSLMGMVDAAIGGKTGIDLGGVKNMVGVYHDPLGVYVHVPFLRTLGKRELLNGVAEMFKHGLVRDAAHWEALCLAQLHDLGTLAGLIERSAAIKCRVVKDDPREGDQRKLLNFGHTIGHGIEAHSWESPQRALLHGEAIAAGMICEAWLSWRLGLLERTANDRIASRLLGLFPHHAFDASAAHRILELMRNDKKNAEGGFRFTLLTGIGSAQVDVPVNAAQVQDALEHYRLLRSERS